jgi:methyltransferase (TIGR00027 family)
VHTTLRGARGTVASPRMYQGLPSFTALFVAGARALASNAPVACCDARDDSAHWVLPRSVARALRAIEARAAQSPLAARALSTISVGMIDHLALRTRAIDGQVVACAERGVRQLVILGAGLDTRAHRLAALAGARVFEIDYPATQAGKRARASNLPLMASSVTYVPVDFAKDALDTELARHGHDPRQPTCFVWEGVTPYLTQEAVVDTLQRARSLAASGSELLVTYVPRSLLRAPEVLRAGMAVLGEPFHFLPEREAFAALLGREGWSVTADTSTRDWRKAYGERRIPGPRITYERLAVARR